MKIVIDHFTRLVGI